jgi:hypothetical protein
MNQPQFRKNPDDSWMSFDQIVFDLYSMLKNDDIKTLAGMTEGEVRHMHFGWGMSIRNTYGMWAEDNPINHDRHPDDVSNDIMVEVWKKVREIAS